MIHIFTTITNQSSISNHCSVGTTSHISPSFTLIYLSLIWGASSFRPTNVEKNFRLPNFQTAEYTNAYQSPTRPCPHAFPPMYQLMTLSSVSVHLMSACSSCIHCIQGFLRPIAPVALSHDSKQDIYKIVSFATALFAFLHTMEWSQMFLHSS